MQQSEFQDLAAKAIAAAQPEAVEDTVRAFCDAWAALLGRHGGRLREGITSAAKQEGYERIHPEGNSPRGPVTAPTLPPTERHLWQCIAIARKKCLGLNSKRCACGSGDGETGDAGPRHRPADYRERRKRERASPSGSGRT